MNVKFAEVVDYVFIETTEGSWNYQTSIAKISGAGYNHEQIYIYLPSLKDTSDYPNPGISNISYTDGLDFVANGFSGGDIYIGHIDSDMVKGSFKVTLTDEFNGAETRTVVGNFGINIH